MAHKWSAREDLDLEGLWASNVLAKDIGKKLSVSVHQVWRRVNRLRLPARNLRIGQNPEVRILLPKALNEWIMAKARLAGKTRNDFIIGLLRSHMHEERRLPAIGTSKGKTK